MSKKMTPTIARALAEKIREKLKVSVLGMDTKVCAKVQSTKEWKEIVKLHTERKKTNDRIDALEKSIRTTYSTGVMDVRVSTYSTGPELRVQENYNVASVEAIKDTLLIEDYMSGGTETAEQLIERITNKLLKP